MYKKENISLEPENENEKIWRIINLDKFLDFVQRRSLYFSKAKKFEDLLEGTYTSYDLDKTKKDPTKSFHEKYVETMKETHYINCWHMNQVESLFMWKKFGKEQNSIAIQSTYKKLKESFHEKNKKVRFGLVNYIDYDLEEMPEGEPLLAYFYKRKSFEHENELRAVFVNDPKSDNYDPSLLEKPGLYLHSYVKSLVESVYVAPESPKWFRELVQGISGKYDLEFNVVNSRLDETPIY